MLPIDLLQSHFGFDRFLPLQEVIIGRVLAEKDNLVVMPTGGGKSLCYQLPAVAFDGLTVVVSPLIALMKDQVVIRTSKVVLRPKGREDVEEDYAWRYQDSFV